MDIDGAEAGDAKGGLADDLAEGGNDEQIRAERSELFQALPAADSLGLVDGTPDWQRDGCRWYGGRRRARHGCRSYGAGLRGHTLERGDLDSGWSRAAPATCGAVGWGEDSDHLVWRCCKPTQSGHGEGGRAHEDNPQTLGLLGL